jgi:4-amino-4-deoxy-L-arabinose transferase-like glycosyltransferase
MRKTDRISNEIYFYLFAVGVFLIIQSPKLLSDGMFMDGITYSTISKNLANGLGTFWNLHFTDTNLSEFHEHPPLAFGIQSIFYTLCGDYQIIDKIYSLLTFILSGLIVHYIWKQLNYKHSWVPITLWLFIPVVIWTSTNNLLENTLQLFILSSFLFYIKSRNKNRIGFLFLAGSSLSLGFLTKGFVTFFPWTAPFVFWLILEREKIGRMVLDSLVLIVSSITPLILLLLFNAEAKMSLLKYFEKQVVNSLKHVETVDSRFFILQNLFSELIPAFALCCIVLLLAKRYKIEISVNAINKKKALTLFAFGLTGVLPVMISMKQSGFYILATMPFFAMSIAILIYQQSEQLLNKINFSSGRFRIFKVSALLVFITGTALSLYFAGSIGRDHAKLSDAHKIAWCLKEGSSVNIHPDLWGDWALHGYYGRYNNISLDPNLSNAREFAIVKKENRSDTAFIKYSVIELNTEQYLLLKRQP